MRTLKNLVILIVASVTFSACNSCNGGGGGGGGITIAQNDSTPPTLSLGVSQPGGQNVTVSAGGAGQSMKLTSKTGMLNLLATAKDSESGVQAVEIWVNKGTTFCRANGTCTQTGPGLLGKPAYESTSPQKKPGETTAESSILGESLDLATMIPQGSLAAGETRTVTLIFFAVAKNHLGGQAQTPELKATWSEP